MTCKEMLNRLQVALSSAPHEQLIILPKNWNWDLSEYPSIITSGSIIATLKAKKVVEWIWW